MDVIVKKAVMPKALPIGTEYPNNDMIGGVIIQAKPYPTR